jgi:hypothetical protein
MSNFKKNTNLIFLIILIIFAGLIFFNYVDEQASKPFEYEFDKKL